jgi:hypothetical protein
VLRSRFARVGIAPAYQFRSAPSPSGKAEVCKTSIPGSNPGGASKFLKKNALLEPWRTITCSQLFPNSARIRR